jgi:hypothetical protein
MSETICISIHKKDSNANYDKRRAFDRFDHRSPLGEDHYVARIDPSQSAQAIRDAIEEFLHPGDRCFLGRSSDYAASLSASGWT